VEFLACHLYIVYDLAQQAGANGLTRVQGHKGAAAIGVPQEGMTAFLPYDGEACFLKCSHNLSTSQRGQLAHTVTL
jgi:hypothetical protein